MARHSKAELVYWEQNGSVLEASMEWEVIHAIIEKGQLCGTWIEGRTPYGYWISKLYVTPGGIYVLRDWVPEHGYCWSEREVYKLKI
ncbi:MAG: hypothetical protein QXT79_02460 [Thermofilaceae archaeon]